MIDCDHKTPPASDEGYPYIAIPQLKNGHISLEGVRRISHVDYLAWTKKLKPQANDVIVVRRCNSGDSAHVPAGLECAIGQNLVVLRASGERVRPDFLRWLLKGPEWWAEVSKYINVGAVFDSLRCRDIPNFELTIPPLEEQAEIAYVLRTLDDRITLLRETNATLEAIAQALFKSWFVDFDPVRAKAEGRQPEGMDATTAALFPDSFEESELGLVPKGWGIGCVGDLASQKKGSVNPLASPGVLYEHYSLPAFDSGQAPVFELGKEIKSNKTPLPEEAVLLSKLNPHIPRVWLPVSHGVNAVCSTEFLAYSPQGGASKELIYCLFGSDTFQQQLCQLVTGTSNSHQRVKPDRVLAVKLPIADKPALRAFTEIVRPLFDRVHAGRLQAQTLTQLRDTLLPRLISGQLRVPDAECTVEDALA